MSANTLAEENMQLVQFVAMKYRSVAKIRGEAYDDILGAGYLGLVNASNTFNPELGFEFKTYASQVIRGTILNHFRDKVPAVKVARTERQLAIQIFRRNLQDESPQKIAAELRCTVEHVAKALESNQASVVLSLQFPNPTDPDLTLEDSIPYEPDLSHLFVSDFVLRLLPRQRQILMLRFQGTHQREIAKAVGISQMSVSRILRTIGEKWHLYHEGKDLKITS